MKSILPLLLCLCLLGACVMDPPPCPMPDEQWVAVGFYRSGVSATGYHFPIDTLFSSIYAVGSSAELAQRRIENFIMLPVPHAGGRVDYVFRQENRQDTLSLFYVNHPMLDANECGLLMKISQIDILQEGTSIKADSIKAVSYFSYVDLKPVSATLAVFVP